MKFKKTFNPHESNYKWTCSTGLKLSEQVNRRLQWLSWHFRSLIFQNRKRCVNFPSNHLLQEKYLKFKLIGNRRCGSGHTARVGHRVAASQTESALFTMAMFPSLVCMCGQTCQQLLTYNMQPRNSEATNMKCEATSGTFEIVFDKL